MTSPLPRGSQLGAPFMSPWICPLELYSLIYLWSPTFKLLGWQFYYSWLRFFQNIMSNATARIKIEILSNFGGTGKERPSTSRYFGWEVIRHPVILQNKKNFKIIYCELNVKKCTSVVLYYPIIGDAHKNRQNFFNIYWLCNYSLQISLTCRFQLKTQLPHCQAVGRINGRRSLKG